MRTKLPVVFSAAIGLILAFMWVISAWDPGPADAVEYTSGGQINLNLNVDDPTLDPSLVRDYPSEFVVNQLFLGLVRADDETGDILPDLAASWEISPDTDVFTFTLRDDVTWSDGTPVTASDVRYGIVRTLDPETDASWVSPLFVIRYAESFHKGEITLEEWEAMGGITVLDNTHLRFTLRQPAAYFLSVLTLRIARAMPAWAIAAHSIYWTEPGNIVTNGPYKLTAWTQGTSMTLDKNPDYFDAANVQIGRIQFSILDDAIAWQRYLAGQLDSVIVPKDQWSVAKDDSLLSLELHSAPRRCTYFYGFNTSKPPFDDLRVRWAFIASVERQGMIDDVLGYAQQPALTFAPPNIFGHVDGDTEGVGISYSPDRARMWLAEAGYPDGVGLPSITLVYYNNWPRYRASAEYVQQNWMHNINVNVNLAGMDVLDYFYLLRTNPPQIWHMAPCCALPDAHDSLDGVVSFSDYFGDWNDSVYQSLLSQATRTADPAERKLIYKLAERILVEDEAIMFPLFYYANGIATRPHLQRTHTNWGYGGRVADWHISWKVFLPIVTR